MFDIRSACRNLPRPGSRPRPGPTSLALALAVTAALIAAPGEAAANRIYKTVDEDGNVVFSDQPPRPDQSGAAVELEPENTFTPPPVDEATAAETPASDDPEEDTPAGPAYRSLAVASPANDEGLRENAGNVAVVAAIDPALGPQHTLQVYLDGELRQSTQSPSAQLLNVDRGTHTLELRIVDESGTVLISSAPSVFHLQRRSVINQPPRPRPAG